MFLSSHTRIIEVEDVSIDNIELKSSDKILIDGSANVIVDLDSGDKDDMVSEESFPFYFKGEWTYESDRLKLEGFNHLSFDTSSFYN